MARAVTRRQRPARRPQPWRLAPCLNLWLRFAGAKQLDKLSLAGKRHDGWRAAAAAGAAQGCAGSSDVGGQRGIKAAPPGLQVLAAEGGAAGI